MEVGGEVESQGLNSAAAKSNAMEVNVDGSSNLKKT